MLVAHKITLKPNKTQVEYFKRACGVSRFAYNWGLAKWIEQHEAGLKPSKNKINKELNALKAEEFPWMYESPKRAPQEALVDLESAFKKLFKKQGGFPKFKKKGVRDSFRLDDGPGSNRPNAVIIEGKKLRLPKPRKSQINPGWVRLTVEPRFKGQIKSAVISRTAHRWFVSLTIDTTDIKPIKRENQAVGGVDLGVKYLATANDGTFYENHKALENNLKKLKRLQQKFSRQMKGSNRRYKNKQKIAKLHYKISCIRKDVLHKATIDLIRKYSIIGIEDLSVKNMMSDKTYARLISDVGMYEFRRQLEYKGEWYGTEIVVADKYFASTQLCSKCGFKNEKLKNNTSIRKWNCPDCGSHHDRDVNAAKNLANNALRSVRPDVKLVETEVTTSKKREINAVDGTLWLYRMGRKPGALPN